MRRILMVFTAMLIPVAGLTLGLAAGTASAGSLNITCLDVNGTVAGTITMSSCTGGNTGGSSVPLTSLSLAEGGTLDWTSGSTTTFGDPTLTQVSASHCPGYVAHAASEPGAESLTAPVTADTGDGILIPGTLTGSVCISNDGNATITDLKKIEFSWTSSSLSCTTVSGNVAGDLTVSNCTGGNTGGGSTSFSAADLAEGGTIPWLSGGSVTIAAPTTASTSAKDCPGYVNHAAINPAAESFTAVVTADTGDGLKLPGSAKGAVCIATDGTISALKPLTAK